MTPTERENEDEWRASPKPKKPLTERLDSLSDKIHKAQYAVRNEKGEVIGFVSFDIYNRIRKQEHDKARNQAIDLFREALSTLQSKEAEYKECSVESNPNWEYFKGKADAYEFAVKQLKRVFEWNDIKITKNNQLT